MKRILTLLAILASPFPGCLQSQRRQRRGGGKNLEGSLEEILEQIYAHDGLSDQFKAFARMAF